MPRNSSAPRILVVEDDPELAFGLRLNLEIEGYTVAVEGDGSKASAILQSFRPDVVILDLMLPGIDGLDLLQQWRFGQYETRIIVLSAKASEADKVAGLRLGADDYVSKPFSLLELLERVRLQLRDQDRNRSTPRTIRFGDATVDLEARVVRRGEQVQHLSEKECALLSALVAARGAPVSKETLLRDIWGHTSAIVTRTVDFHIGSLRRKIEPRPHNPQFIMTVHKLGYRVQL
jgi:DNA-binding response OmpR family regulator